MWYAIFIIAGLSLGIGMMVWALLERKKRYAAESRAKEYKNIAENNAKVVEEVEGQSARMKNERDLLMKELERLHDFIDKNVDPSVVYEDIRKILGQV